MQGPRATSSICSPFLSLVIGSLAPSTGLLGEPHVSLKKHLPPGFGAGVSSSGISYLSDIVAMGGFLGLASRQNGFVHSLITVLLVVGSILGVQSADTNTKTASLTLAAYNSTNFQLFRLDTSGALSFQQSITGAWQSGPETISLTVAPKPNSPLAACSWSPTSTDGDTYIRMYYLDVANTIIELVGVCQRTTCTWKNNKGLNGTSVSPSSGLAVSLWGSPQGTADWGMKIFYIDTSSLLSEVSYSKSTKWVNGSVIGPKVSPGSSLAVSSDPGATNFQVYYHSTATVNGAIAQISYDNATKKWSSGTTIKTLPLSSPLPSLAAVILPSPLSRRIYFINSTRYIEALSSTDNGVTWVPLPQTANTTPQADTPGAPIVATSWLTKARIIYSAGGNISEMSMQGTGKFYLRGTVSALAAAEGTAKTTTGSDGKTTAAGAVDEDDTPAAEVTSPGGNTAGNGSGSKTEGDSSGKKEETTTGGPQPLKLSEKISIATGCTAATFTIAGAIWKWKWLQRVWAKWFGKKKREEDSDGEVGYKLKDEDEMSLNRR